ncbi:MAG TPA: gluconokinase [Bryobacteraceae bacterium]
MPDNSPTVLTLDAGSSSVRTLLFDAAGKPVDGFGTQLPYSFDNTPDGGLQIDPDRLVSLCVKALSAACVQLRHANIKPAAVACDTFWHSIMGVDSDGRPATPLLHLLDTRSESAADDLRKKVDNRAQHARTGCVIHASYPASKLLWLSQAKPDDFARVTRWMSIGEYLYLSLLGEAAASTSMVSATGLWDQNRNDYDEELMSVLPVRRDQFPDPAHMDQPVSQLRGDYKKQLPELDGIPWFPALGDGACDNVGSGCVTPENFALMVGTTGAMRVVFERDQIDIPAGLWCYRVDRRRAVIGGAISSGGEVFAWMKQTLQLPNAAETEKQIAAMAPGSHGLTVLPYFAGERSTGWRSDARAAIAGMGVATTPIHILRASLESVALQFRNIYDIMVRSIAQPQRVIASGGALLHSPAWTCMMADALSRPVVACLEPEATSRGAALMALERLGVIHDLGTLPPSIGNVYNPVPEHWSVYSDELARQRVLYHRLFEER